MKSIGQAGRLTILAKIDVVVLSPNAGNSGQNFYVAVWRAEFLPLQGSLAIFLRPSTD